MTDTIRIGGRPFAIAPLRFRDLKRVLPLFLDLGIDTETRLDAQGEIVTAAIRAVDPSFTRAAFDDLAPTIGELQAAVAAVAELSGLERRRGAPQGEIGLGEAGAAGASTGESSTP